MSRGGPGPPFCGILNISALHFQYEIQAFAKFKRPECTRLHLGEFTLKNFPGVACARLEKCAVRSPIVLKHKFFSSQITTVALLVSERDQFFALQF